MTLTQTLIASAVALCALQPQAFTWSITSGAYSTQAGARHETFDNLATDAKESADLAYVGGALFNASVGGITARPPGSIGNFLSVGSSDGQVGPIVVDLVATPASYFGFLWGSPDGYNQVDFLDDKTLLKSLSGSDVFSNPSPANGFQGALRTASTSTPLPDKANGSPAWSSARTAMPSKSTTMRSSPCPNPAAGH
jgi:nitrogen fixation-related uncharacterized protein